MGLDPQRPGVLDSAQRDLPDQFLRIEVNRTHAAERRGVARHAQGRLENVDFYTAINTGHLRANGTHETWHFVGRHLELVRVFLGDQCHAQGHAHVIDEHHAGVLVNGNPAPVHPAQQARPFNIGLFARRGERAHIDRILEQDPAIELVECAHAPHGFFGQRLGANHRHACRERLGRRQVFAYGCRGGWYGAFFNGGHRQARAPVQDKDIARLGGLDQHRGFHALGILDVVQHRLRRQVIVPDIVMDGLVHPLGLAGRSIHSDHGRAVFLLGLVAVAAPIVGRAVAGGQVDQVQLFVVSRNGPYIGGFQGELVIGLCDVAVLRRTHIPCPGQLTGQHIKCAHGTRRFTGHNIPHPATHHGEMAHDHRQGSGVVALAVFGGAHAFFQVNIAVVAKARAQGAALGIQGKQTGIHRGHQNALTALLLIVVGRFDFSTQAVVLVDVVIAHAPASNMLFAFGVRIELPQRLAGIGVKGGDQIFRGAGVQHIADLQRGIFVDTRARAAGAAARTVDPGHLQVIDIVRGDLSVRRKAGTRCIAAKELPVLRSR